jgi:hypothetical protein
MAHIAAFLTGRETPTSDGDLVLCLGPRHFAEYILRICRALAGGKDGGLLHLVQMDTFVGPDGDSFKAGLSFLWTGLIFAVAEVTALWRTPLRMFMTTTKRLNTRVMCGTPHRNSSPPDSYLRSDLIAECRIY